MKRTERGQRERAIEVVLVLAARGRGEREAEFAGSVSTVDKVKDSLDSRVRGAMGLV